MKNLVDLGEGIKAGILIITPVAAERMLECNTKNRSPKLGKMSEYAIDMKEGKWDFNGVPIIFGETGRLLDGQNRLMAIVRSNTAIKTLIVTGVPEKTFTSIDTGANRSGKDILTIVGLEPLKASIMSSLIKRIIKSNINDNFNGIWVNKGFGALSNASNKKYSVSNHEILEYYKNNKIKLDIRYDFAIRYRKTASKVIDFSKFILAFSILAEIDSYDAEYFFTKLATGSELEVDHPIYVLREKLISIKATKDTSPIPGWHYWALIVKAWNVYRKRAKITRLFISSSQTEPGEPI